MEAFGVAFWFNRSPFRHRDICTGYGFRYWRIPDILLKLLLYSNSSAGGGVWSAPHRKLKPLSQAATSRRVGSLQGESHHECLLPHPPLEARPMSYGIARFLNKREGKHDTCVWEFAKATE